MPKLSGLGNIWNILREIDLDGIHHEAGRPVAIVIAGDRRQAETLARLLQTDQKAGKLTTTPALRTTDLPINERTMASADLIIAVGIENRVLESIAHHVPTLAVVVDRDTLTIPTAAIPVSLPALEAESVTQWLAPVIIRQLRNKALAAARQVPALREAYGHWLIQETSQANALYALGTGVAESLPILTVPLNVADIMVLTKNQLIMVYRLALATGREMSPWTVIPELIGVVGIGFLWRQVARELVGLIPIAGVVPKVAVAYAGTFAIGTAALAYLLTGEMPARDQIKTLYATAIEQGREIAQTLIDHVMRDA